MQILTQSILPALRLQRCCLLSTVLGYLDELLEEVDGQGVLLTRALWTMKLAVIFDIHALARVWVVYIIFIIIVELHLHPVKWDEASRALEVLPQ